ncbi:hypothetical protein FHS61_002205 [Altererythrobacter atlanticus]|uniref:Uncharacterized protein n=1 Tax=Croceibacterium atlanticum TaxID=1267766 RepID=A0A0F7KSH4_9SPHN|nr:hypothetical protein [Croceibacterium atlanticum]AKH41715.1 hypothetical protein WYH_00659 [Croceibacterium atlanticum]MBB5733179.1 hypothetical protein [Croceibacterium atlanticum]
MRLAGSFLAALLAVFGLAATANAQSAPENASGKRGPGVSIVPYIEASQVLTAELEPGSDVLTYSTVAAGVDAGFTGRNSAGTVSLRYERRIGWGDDALDGDTLSGIARTSIAVIPRALTFEAGGLAARTRVEGNGSSSLGGFGGNDDSTSQIYSIYAGPSIKTREGYLDVSAHYRFGYTRVEEPNRLVLADNAQAPDIFDESTVHMAQARMGFSPNTVLPVGLGVGGSWNEQNISNLDQRIRDRNIRADVTVPVTLSLALVGGVGYEDVQISSRDALRDGNGVPVIGNDGRYVTDKSGPRRIAYETDGLIWDVGVMWRPSRRTSLEAHVGRRYGSTSYYGTLSYTPNSRSSLNVSVYDNMTGFGGAVVDRLAGLPTDFETFRNPISGDIGGCVASLEGDGCIGGVLGSLRSAAFRSRGIAISYAYNLGRTQLGIGGGYDRRKFIAAAGTVLASADGVVDDNIWLSAYSSTRLDAVSSINANLYASLYDSGFDSGGEAIGYSATLAYNRTFLRNLTGTAALGLDGITREDLEDFMSASALLGLRYSF